MLTEPRPTSRTRPRAGFTLIELVIAISIIALLIALLFPAVNGVMTSARVAAVKTEMSGLEAAIASFKNTYGSEPPSYIDLSVTAGASTAFTSARTMPALRSLFGTAVSETAMIESLAKTGFYGTPRDFSVAKILRGAECLVFFLGGLPAETAVKPDGTADTGVPTADLVGFSKNPRDPFNTRYLATTGGTDGEYAVTDRAQREPPMYEFKPGPPAAAERGRRRDELLRVPRRDPGAA